MLGLPWNAVWKVSFFRDAFFFVKSLHLWEFRDVDGYGDALAATGTVTFKDGSTTLGTGTISGGQATFSSSKLAQGSHYLTAVYGGSAKYNGSTSLLLIQVVNKANTTVTLASSANPSAYRSSVKFTATVTPTTATGTVTFTEGSTTLGTGTISAGKATFSISTLAVGSNSITASYGGDTNDNSSTSSVLTQTVNKTNTTVTLASSANPSAYGASVTFTATVAPTTATGTVTFTEGSTTLGTGTISAGKATFSISTLAVGSNSIKASYGGDTNDNSSTSSVLTQRVNKDEHDRHASFVCEPIGIWRLGDVHGHGDAHHGDGYGDVHGWKHDAGNGDDQQRERHIQHFDAGEWLTIDQGFLWRGHKRQRQHVDEPDADGKQNEHDRHASFVCEPIGIWGLGDVHGHGERPPRRRVR